MRLPTRILLIGLTSLATESGLIGQTSSESVVTLEKFQVTGLPVEQSINPLTREISSVLGDSRDLLGTPRSVSTLTTALFNERQIHGVREILLYSPGSYAGASYGKTTVPNLRGDTAETYLNGQRLSYNLYGYFPSFNGVEAVDLVRGPGSAVYGAGYFQGGYVNYVTKKPQFSQASTVITTRVGTWAPGDSSFLNGSIQIDTTAPVSDRLAWRVSLEGKGGQTYFRRNDVRDDRLDAFGALTWKPHDGTQLEFVVQYLWQAAPEILGVNRPTQELIDSARYYTGDSADLSPFPGPIPATGSVILPRDATLFSKGDFSNANVVRSQAVVTREVAPDLTLVNRTLFEHVNRRRVHQFEYAEYVTQDTVENRSEVQGKFSIGDTPQKVIAGATLRYEGRRSFTNYFNEYFYNFDITNPLRVFDERARYGNSYFEGFVGPGGREFFPASYDSPETVRSETLNPSVFWQHDISFTSKLSATIGLREDVFFARARDPLAQASGIPFRDAETVSAFSEAYSLTYRVGPRASLYATHNRMRSALGNVTGGGVILNTPDGQINREDFRNLSELLEIGIKTSWLENRLYATATVFDQTRSRASIGGRKNNIQVSGVELETVYQPDARFQFTANATFQNGRYLQSRPFQLGGRSIYSGYAEGRGPGGRGTAGAEYDPYDNQVPTGDWPLLGFSDVLLNGSVRYRWPNGFGAGATVAWQSEQPGNLDKEWMIRDQVLIDLSVSYETKRWTANLDLLNVTNERNWIHNGDAYTGSQIIFAELPFRLEGYIKLRF
jgi:outer membrane receptor for monomeric catechols